MTSAGRSDRAMFLSAVAVVGLVAAPLLHAEEHCREELEDEADAWRAGSSDPLEALEDGKLPLTRVEVYQPCEPTRRGPAQNSKAKFSEPSPGVYTVGPLRFDQSGRWVVRYHLYEECLDGEGRRHGHSHGPASPDPHGSGALAHLGIALHAAPQLPDVVVPPPQHAAPAVFEGQLRAPLRYLVPERAQGPPIGC